VRPAIFRPAAAADIEDAFLWYEAHRDGFGDEFLETVRSALESIVRHPESAPVVHGDIRRQLLRRFPNGLFYRVADGQVVVLGCLHGRRSPAVWRPGR